MASHDLCLQVKTTLKSTWETKFENYYFTVISFFDLEFFFVQVLVSLFVLQPTVIAIIPSSQMALTSYKNI